MAGPWRRPYNFRPSAPRRMFSSMFHPPPTVHTLRTPVSHPFLGRSLSALTLSHATVRRRRATKKRKSRGNSTPRESVAFHAERGGRIFATPLSRRVYFLPRPLVFMDGTTVPNDEKGGGEIVSARALLIFLRGRYSSVPLEEALKRARWSTRFFSSSPLLRPIGGGTTISVARP